MSQPVLAGEKWGIGCTVHEPYSYTSTYTASTLAVSPCNTPTTVPLVVFFTHPNTPSLVLTSSVPCSKSDTVEPKVIKLLLLLTFLKNTPACENWLCCSAQQLYCHTPCTRPKTSKWTDTRRCAILIITKETGKLCCWGRGAHFSRIRT